jgi:diaminopimelate decarboxylase
MKIRPKINSNLQKFIESQDLFALKNLHTGVIHIGFPQEIKQNIDRIKAVFEKLGVELKLYLAHKATKNQAFVKQALKCGIGIDVASINELVSALSSGFTGDKIEATGPKNNDFLQLALLHSCLISLDSIEELQRLIEIYQKLNLKTKIPILIRLNNPEIVGRNVKVKDSRFGSDKGNLENFYDLIKQHNFLNFKGLHFHADGYDPSMRAGILEGLINILEQGFEQGFNLEIINLGGALRDQTLQDYQDWSDYLEILEHKLLNNQKLPTWANQSYGLFVNEKAKIGGKDKALSRFYKSSFDTDLQTTLESENEDGRILADVLNENMFNLALEPGYAILQQAGITLVEIIEVKKASDGRNLIVIDANLYNLGLAKMFQYVTDPILVSKQKDAQEKIQSENNFSSLIVGNLCREDDFLMDREVVFDKQPKPGDLLIFTNTAAYFAGFEDASPIMHPTSKFLVAYKQNTNWKITIPENYNPFEN